MKVPGIPLKGRRVGYPLRRVGAEYVFEHRLVAECALGKPLPPGAEVHHVDGNRANNRPSNLVICQDAAYHRLLHARTRVVKAGGNPNTDRICGTCQQVKALGEFNTGQTVCRACHAQTMREWVEKNRDKRRAYLREWKREHRRKAQIAKRRRAA